MAVIARNLLCKQHHNSRTGLIFGVKKGTGFCYQEGFPTKQELFQWVMQTYGERWVSIFAQIKHAPLPAAAAAPAAAGPSAAGPSAAGPSRAQPRQHRARFDARAAAAATEDASRQAGLPRSTRSGKRPAVQYPNEEEDSDDDMPCRRMPFAS